ncbi:Uncharacterised protein [Vibrio cholerae]|nr:Uncharacterised protein [Vibrio cholerae]
MKHQALMFVLSMSFINHSWTLTNIQENIWAYLSRNTVITWAVSMTL